MDSIHTVVPSNTLEAPQQKMTFRFGTVRAVDINAFPGATLAAERKAARDVLYSIMFKIPVTGSVGTPDEASQIHEFAHQLDLQSRTKGVGAVLSVWVMNGTFDVVLKLNMTGEQVSHGSPTANDFTVLKDYLDNALVLKEGPAGKPATYKVLVNANMIAEGSY